MSGPKSFRTRVTNAHLQQIFALQSEISIKCDELGRLSLNDRERKIFADCSDFLRGTQRLKKDLLKPISVEYVDELPAKLRPLQDFLAKIEAEKQNFHQKEQDYQAFLSYENYYASSTQSLQTFKTQVTEYLQTYLEQDHAEVYQQAKKKMAPVSLSLKQEPFSWNFRNVLSQKKQVVDHAVEQAKGMINGVRIEVSNKVLAMTKADMPSSGITRKHPDRNIQTSIEKIKDYLANVPDNKARQAYQNQLNDLLKSDTRKNDAYFYTELLDDLKQAERTREIKKDLTRTLTELSRLNVHAACTSEYQQLRQHCQKLLNRSKIKSYQIEDFQSRVATFTRQNDQQFQEELVQEKERQFIRSQLITSLERLNYEVMDEMEVIDFEKDCDFVLKIPNQENFLNLRFMADGSFRYNFLIPEFKDDLSIDQIKTKIHEMESACRNFKKHVRHLASLGIEIDIVKELPISEKAVMQIPQKLRDRIQHREGAKARRKVEQTVKKQLQM